MAKATLDGKARRARSLRRGHAGSAFIVAASAMVGLCDAPPAHASAFFLREQSAAALGNALPEQPPALTT